MRLLYVCTDLGIDPRGTKGASIHVREITRALADLGHEVELLSPHAPPSFDERIRCIPVEQSSRVRESERSLRRWLLDRDLDTAPASEFRSILFGAEAIPQVIDALRSRPVDAIIERLSLFGHVGVDLSRALELPLLMEINAVMTEEAAAFRSLHLETLAKRVELRALESADALLPVSAGLARRLDALGVPDAKVHVVPNGVDVSRFHTAPSRAECRRELGLDSAFVVGFSGSLKPWHGVDVLVAAFARLRKTEPGARLLIVGAGPTEAELREQAQRLGVADAVVFTGAVQHDAIPKHLKAMDVAVAPYPAQENFYFSPLKVFEYMASGTCMIASRIGQITELVRDGENGLLCSPGDEEALCATIDRARQSANLRRDLADKARQTVETRFTWKHAARRVSAVALAVSRSRRRRMGAVRPHKSIHRHTELSGA